MYYSATLTKTGQITIPKPVRLILGIEPGQRVIFKKTKDSVSIAREKTAEEISAEIDAIIPDETRAYHMREYAGMTSSEIREKWFKTPDAKKYFKEERKRTL